MPRQDIYVGAESAAQQINVDAPEPEPAPAPAPGGAAAPPPPVPPVGVVPPVPELPPGLLGKATSLTIIAQDPAKTDRSGRPITSTVRIPAERVLPGPRDHRFYVVDLHAEGPQLGPTRLTQKLPGEPDPSWRLVDRFAGASRARLLSSRDFHAQNVFAISVGLLTRFEEVLGRRVPWRFGSHHLYLSPHAFLGGNAGYSPDDRCIRFGYLPGPDPVFTCLSHDVVAHELTHAILDGLRPRFIEPGLPDQLAFHEGFADIVALLSVFSRSEIVAELLAGQIDGVVDAALFDADNLKSTALFTIGEQLGSTLDRTRGGLRQSLADVPTGSGWRTGRREAHHRGEVLVAVICEVVATIWAARLDGLRHQGEVPVRRAAEEGSKVASQVLGMCIRALDYLPPIEFEFEDFLDAIIAADTIVVPDDERGYRQLLADAFARFDIERPVGVVIHTDHLVHPWRYQGINHKALSTSADEVYRFLWQNAELLGIDLRFHLQVERVLAITRGGPDGLVVEEIIADYTQTISATLTELPAPWRSGVGAPPDTEIQAWGGGVVVFDQYGIARHHVTKPLLDARRQNRRLRHLADSGLYDTRGRLGFSYGTSNSRQFQALHDPRGGERW